MRRFEKEFFEKARPSSILQRFATPEEIAVTVQGVGKGDCRNLEESSL